MRRIAAVACIILVTTGFAWLERWAAPDARLVDPHWQQHDPNASTDIDHGPWAAFLEEFVVVDAHGVHRVRYGAVGAADRAAIAAYLDTLAATRVTGLARDAQLAYWLNLYNALTVATVLDAYPVASIRDIAGAWTAKRVTVEDRPLSLDDIEHGIIRPIFDDPRIHYAVNCAAVGCPDLQPVPFEGGGLERQLDAAARAYVNDPRGVSVRTGGDVVISSIYNWFNEDFGDSEAAVFAHLRRYAAPDLRRRLEGVTRARDYAYDWALNDAR
jgi:hypothetical protein